MLALDRAEVAPVLCLQKDDGLAYIAWLAEQTGKELRLPTRTEWELIEQLDGLELGALTDSLVADGRSAASEARGLWLIQSDIPPYVLGVVNGQ